MPSTYTDLLRLEDQATGENDDTWGDISDTNLDLIEDAIAGRVSKSLAAGDVTLSTNNGAADEARMMVVEVTGTLPADRKLIVPNKSKIYVIDNATSGSFAVTVETASASAVATIEQGKRSWVVCDGSNNCELITGGAVPVAAGTTDIAGSIGFTSTELTIASGSITPTGTHHTVDTQSDDSTDDLDTITTGSVASTPFLILRAEHTDRTVVVKHGTGNISTPDGQDISITSTEIGLVLVYDGSQWIVLGHTAALARTEAGTTVNFEGSVGLATSELTIASGAVTPTGSQHTIDTESDDAADDLDTINVTSVATNAWLLIRAENAARVVTIKHDTGNIQTDDGTDIALSSADHTVLLARVGSAWKVISRPTQAAAGLPRAYGSGCTLSNGTDADHDIDIAVGAWRGDSNAADLVLASALTKQIDAAWAVGTNQGGLDTGSVTTDSWYDVYLIKRSDTGVVDALFTLAGSGPTMPSNYDVKRRLGAVLTDGSSNIIGFSQLGDEFLWLDPPLDVDVTNLGASATLYTLSVPTGVQVHVFFNHYGDSGVSNSIVYFSSPDADDEAPSNTAAPLVTMRGDTNPPGMPMRPVRTNTSGQIRARSNQAGIDVKIATLGWLDRRGRDD